MKWRSHPEPAADTAIEFDVLVSRTAPATVVISLVGDHDMTSVRTFQTIADAQLDHCDKLVVDFTSTNEIAGDVLAVVVELAGQARDRGVPFQIVSRQGSHVHDLLELYGILDRLDCTDRLPNNTTAPPHP